MRYFKITISDPSTGEVLVPNLNGKPGFSRQPANGSLASYTSLNPGAGVTTLGGTNLAAPEVVLDIPMSVLHLPQLSNGSIRIKGIGIGEISQASNLRGLNIAVYGGMAKGLPLANPAQSGLLASGQIQRAYGNWTGVDTELAIFMMAAGSSPSSNQTSGNPNQANTVPVPSIDQQPANIVFQWKQGQPLMSAIVNALSVAFPAYKIQGGISENLVWASGQAETGFYSTFHQFSRYIHELSLSVLGGPVPDAALYSGVNMALNGNIVTVFDGSTPTTPKVLKFTDLIGQPTWDYKIDVLAKVVLRGDLGLGDYVTLPPLQGTTASSAPTQSPLPGTNWIATAGSFSASGPNEQINMKQSSIFQGTYRIGAIRHVGESRNQSATAWCSVLNLTWVPPVSTAPVSTLPIVYSSSSPFGFYLPM